VGLQPSLPEKKTQKEINNTTKTINHRRIYRRNRTHRSPKGNQELFN